ncbi:hypothetical protein TTRE_0000404601 [Trichuris trichiura]|uniref:Uncharacterized protein n=1 Tax=Trichuris trichiura TaxID=36087 RepID=A0A077Z833_TRITR|nr:hypothetical protein TTRE_0000404601 [Trichuris trichiura]
MEVGRPAVFPPAARERQSAAGGGWMRPAVALFSRRAVLGPTGGGTRLLQRKRRLTRYTSLSNDRSRSYAERDHTRATHLVWKADVGRESVVRPNSGQKSAPPLGPTAMAAVRHHPCWPTVRSERYFKNCVTADRFVAHY